MQQIILVDPLLAQTPKKPSKAADTSNAGQVWMLTSGGLLLILIALAGFSKWKFDQLKKQLKFEDFKNKELQKKLKLAAQTITKMETNPDLIHSREFNLDYLRLRMEEEIFHFAIVNQIKIKVKERISVALRPNQANEGTVGVASTGRQVDETFDVEYEPENVAKGTKRVLFRIQIRLTKLPTQPTSVTVNQIIDCLEIYLSPKGSDQNWQPTLQGRIAQIHWDQKAKPTPLLVLEQTSEGMNVTFRTERKMTTSRATTSTNQAKAQAKVASGKKRG